MSRSKVVWGTGRNVLYFAAIIRSPKYHYYIFVDDGMVLHFHSFASPQMKRLPPFRVFEQWLLDYKPVIDVVEPPGLVTDERKYVTRQTVPLLYQQYGMMLFQCISLQICWVTLPLPYAVWKKKPVVMANLHVFCCGTNILRSGLDVCTWYCGKSKTSPIPKVFKERKHKMER